MFKRFPNKDGWVLFGESGGEGGPGVPSEIYETSGRVNILSTWVECMCPILGFGLRSDNF